MKIKAEPQWWQDKGGYFRSHCPRNGFMAAANTVGQYWQCWSLQLWKAGPCLKENRQLRGLKWTGHSLSTQKRQESNFYLGIHGNKGRWMLGGKNLSERGRRQNALLVCIAWRTWALLSYNYLSVQKLRAKKLLQRKNWYNQRKEG